MPTHKSQRCIFYFTAAVKWHAIDGVIDKIMGRKKGRRREESERLLAVRQKKRDFFGAARRKRSIRDTAEDKLVEDPETLGFVLFWRQKVLESNE